jgi:hypothetical protein
MKRSSIPLAALILALPLVGPQSLRSAADGP